jgi:ech hydrogenase subunit B
MEWLYALIYIIAAPIAGGLLAGIDRLLSARMQGRYGPPILQPFYDVAKLMRKEIAEVNRAERFLVIMFLVFMVVTGALFFAGGDILLVIFALTLSSIFLLIAAYSTNSPFSNMGADRELLTMMAYEPMVLFTAIGFYMVTKSFAVSDIAASRLPAVIYMPGIFIGFVFILTFKFRKSPFDISTSHHAHQELVKGLTTEFSGPTLALVEIAHWYENIMLLGFVYLFFAWQTAISPVVAVAVCLAIYFLEIVIDNSFARVRWKMALGTTWVITATAGFLNIILLSFIS